MEDSGALSPRAAGACETDETVSEIVRFAVDDADQVRLLIVRDMARLPTTLQWPTPTLPCCALSVWPEPQRTNLTRLINQVRTTGRAESWEFDSAVVPGELRRAAAMPLPRGRWVSLVISHVISDPISNVGMLLSSTLGG